MAPVEEFDPIQYWLRDQGSEKTKKKSQQTLDRFAKYAGASPAQLLEDGIREFCEYRQPPRKLGLKLIQWYHHLIENEHCKESSAKTYFNTVHGFFSANSLVLISLPKTLDAKGAPFPERALTQDEVRAMVESRDRIEHKAIIAFLAQTGQREQVLPAITHSMIRPVDMGGKYPLHGVVNVSAELRNYEDTPANKCKCNYVFVIGHDAMTLLNSVRPSVGDCYFPIDWRKIIRLVERAAEEVGIQRVHKSRQGHKIHEVTPHTLRAYWKSRMNEARVDDNVSRYMMGHPRPPSDTYNRASFKEENLLKLYVQAEKFLSIS
jgi:integrase